MGMYNELSEAITFVLKAKNKAGKKAPPSHNELEFYKAQLVEIVDMLGKAQTRLKNVKDLIWR